MRLGVIFGGRSVEHEVSVVSAMDVLREADPARFDAIPIGVTRDGRWLTPAESQRQLDRDDPLFEKRIDVDVPALLRRGEVMDALAMLDAVFPLVHGVNGEDGTLQGMLEMFGLPYAGCGVAASAVGMDKAVQKQLFQRAGLRVARHVVVLAHEWQACESLTRRLESAVGYPAFVKPSNGGSSVGVTKVRSREDLGEAMRAAFALDRKVLVEEALTGHEADCGVIGNERPVASPVGEVVLASEFYDYTAKYLDDSAQIVVPARLNAQTEASVQDAAVRAFRALDCQGFARVDFFVEEGGEPVVSEINTLPGFRPVSMFPRLWQAAGVSYRDLISRLVDLGLERHREMELRRGRS